MRFVGGTFWGVGVSGTIGGGTFWGLGVSDAIGAWHLLGSEGLGCDWWVAPLMSRQLHSNRTWAPFAWAFKWRLAIDQVNGVKKHQGMLFGTGFASPSRATREAPNWQTFVDSRVGFG